MVESFLIETNLNVKGNALKMMQQFAKSTTFAAKEQKNLLGSLTKVNLQLEKMAKHLVVINPNLNKLANSFLKLGTEIRTSNMSLNHFNEGLIGAEGNAQRLKHQADTLKNSLNSLSHAGRNASRSLSTVGKGNISAPVSAASGRARHGFAHGIMHGAGAFSGSAIGSPGLAAGLATGAMIKGGYKAQSDFERRRAQFMAQGFTSADMAKVDNFVQNTHIPGVSQADLTNAIVTSAMATGDVNKAIEMSPQIAKLRFANQAIFKKGMSEHQQSHLVRFAELRAGSNPAKVASQIDLAQQAIMSMGGKMNASQLLNFQQMATSAGYHLTDQGFLKLLPILQEMGGFRAGTGYQTMFNRLITGKGLGTASGVEGQRVGLLERGRATNGMLDKQPTLKKEYASMLQTDLVGFTKNILLPLYKSRGITSEMDITKENAIVFDRTAARVLDNIIKNMDKIDRMFPLHSKAQNVESSYLSALNLEPGKMEVLKTAWTDLNKAFGMLTRPAVVGAMDALTSFITKLTHVLNSINFGTVKQGTAGAQVFNNTGQSRATSLFSISDKSDAKTMPPINIFLDGEKVKGALSRAFYSTFNPFVDHGSSTNNTGIVPQSNSINSAGNGIS